MVQAQEDMQIEQNTEMDALQGELEERVKTDLDELTVLVNNKYARGKHVFDYQLRLVQLSPQQIAAEKLALQKAEKIEKRHDELVQSEEAMSKKLDATRKQLEDYREKFYKSKKALEQDHQSFVTIREKEASELDKEVARQRELEV